MHKDGDFLYWGEARREFRQIISDTFISMMLSPKYEAKGLESDEANAYDARVAHYNDGIVELARALLKQIEEAVEDD